MSYFYKDYECQVDPTERLVLRVVEARGRDLEEMLENCEISLQDWHGNEGPNWSLSDLPSRLILMITQDIAAALQDEADHRAEAAAENAALVTDLNSRRGKL